MKLEWVRGHFPSLSKEKRAFFFKQWGGVRKDLHGASSTARHTTRCPARSRRRFLRNIACDVMPR